MLQSTPLSKVYGHGHIKKFWLMQNQKEAENKALLASSSSRNAGNSSGLGHESKQGTQFSVGNTSTRMLTSPSGLPVRPLVSGPAFFNMAMARQTSLVTCAESLSPPVRMEQAHSSVRPPSPSMSASISKEENCSLATDTDRMSLKSPCQEDANSASTLQWKASLRYGDQLTGDFCSPITSTEGRFSDMHEFSPSIRESRHKNETLQEGFQQGNSADDAGIKTDNSGPLKGSLGFFSKLETATPFAVPFQLPKKYLLEAGAKLFDAEANSEVGGTSGNSCPDKSALPPTSSCGHGRRALFGTVEGGASKEDGLCTTVLRTCSVCGTSKTPLWRSGPQGPKSLCNACGIRFKKAKRGSSEGVGCPTTTLLASPAAKTSLKPVKRKQDTPSVNADTHLKKPLLTNGLATQVLKKRRWSQLIRKGECVAQNFEVTGSSNESSLTWNLQSPSAVSSPSVSHFERLSIAENSTASDMVAGKDEEEAAVLLMYMSWGLVFA